MSRAVVVNDVKFKEITTSNNFPNGEDSHIKYFYSVGLIVGVSRQFDRYGRATNHKPYKIHVTDFNTPTYSRSQQFFEGVEFNDPKLNHKVYDFMMFPECFDQLANDVKSVNLKEKIRSFDYYQRRVQYLDDLNRVVPPGEWFDKRLDGHGIWGFFKLRTHVYMGVTELQCCNSFSVIPLKQLEFKLKSFGHAEIWENYRREYEYTHIFDALDLDTDMDTDSSDEDDDGDGSRARLIRDLNGIDDFSRNESSLLSQSSFIGDESRGSINSSRIHSQQEPKRRRVDDSFSQNIGYQSTQKSGISQILTDTITVSKKYKNMNYSLISDVLKLKTTSYQPQFIIVEDIILITPKESYVYLNKRRLLETKQVKVRVSDENHNSLVVYIQGPDLKKFLGITKVEMFQHLEDEAISKAIEGRYSYDSRRSGSYGMVVSPWDICDGIRAWKWEYTTGVIPA